MTSNQKLFFSNNLNNLVSARTKNAAMIGAFSITVGVLILLQVGSLHFLAMASGANQGHRSNLQSRLPVMEPHEQVDFSYLNHSAEDEVVQADVKAAKPAAADPRAQDLEDHRELIQKQDRELAQQALSMRFGAAPGQSAYDQYQSYGQQQQPFRGDNPIFSNNRPGYS
jgi:hypothetical protein